jgi:hypothetical protein
MSFQCGACVGLAGYENYSSITPELAVWTQVLTPSFSDSDSVQMKYRHS